MAKQCRVIKNLPFVVCSSPLSGIMIRMINAWKRQMVDRLEYSIIEARGLHILFGEGRF